MASSAADPRVNGTESGVAPSAVSAVGSSLLSSLKELEMTSRPKPSRIELSQIVEESLEEAQNALSQQIEADILASRQRSDLRNTIPAIELDGYKPEDPSELTEEDSPKRRTDLSKLIDDVVPMASNMPTAVPSRPLTKPIEKKPTRGERLQDSFLKEKLSVSDEKSSLSQTTCKFCKKSFPSSDFIQHLQFCTRPKTPGLAQTTCKFCKESIPATKFISHLQNCNEEVGKRIQAEKQAQLEKLHKEAEQAASQSRRVHQPQRTIPRVQSLPASYAIPLAGGHVPLGGGHMLLPVMQNLAVPSRLPMMKHRRPDSDHSESRSPEASRSDKHSKKKRKRETVILDSDDSSWESESESEVGSPLKKKKKKHKKHKKSKKKRSKKRSKSPKSLKRKAGTAKLDSGWGNGRSQSVSPQKIRKHVSERDPKHAKREEESFNSMKSRDTERGRNTRQSDRDTRQPDRDTRQPDRDTRQPDRDTRQPDRDTRQPDRDTRQPDRKPTKFDRDTRQSDRNPTKVDRDTRQPDWNNRQSDRDIRQPDRDMRYPDSEARYSDRGVKRSDRDARDTDRDVIKKPAVRGGTKQMDWDKRRSELDAKFSDRSSGRERGAGVSKRGVPAREMNRERDRQPDHRKYDRDDNVRYNRDLGPPDRDNMRPVNRGSRPVDRDTRSVRGVRPDGRVNDRDRYRVNDRDRRVETQNRSPLNKSRRTRTFSPEDPPAGQRGRSSLRVRSPSSRHGRSREPSDLKRGPNSNAHSRDRSSDARSRDRPSRSEFFGGNDRRSHERPRGRENSQEKGHEARRPVKSSIAAQINNAKKKILELNDRRNVKNDGGSEKSKANGVSTLDSTDSHG
eukprot:436748_1